MSGGPRSWWVTGNGDPERVMRLRAAPLAPPGPGEVEVAVAAVGLGFPDLLLSRGEYHDKPAHPFVPGGEAAGTVVAVGDGVDTALLESRVIVTPGETVTGLLAEGVVVPQDRLLPVPDDMPLEEAAALFVAYQTAYLALVRRGGLTEGETVLIFGAASGVGYAAVQLARSWGATVIAVTTGADRAAVAGAAGAHHVIDRSSTDVVAEVREVTAGVGAHVVLDPVGGPAFVQAQKVIALEGRLVVVGFASGEIPAPAVNHLLLRNYSVVGCRTRPFRDDPAYRRQVHDVLCGLFAQGEIRPLVETMPFERAPAAVARIDAGGLTGRLVCVR